MFSNAHGLQSIASSPKLSSAQQLPLLLEEEQRHVKPHVCILARTCGPQSHCKPRSSQLKAFLFSLVAQSYTDWELHLLNAEGGGEVFEDAIADIQDQRVSNGPSNPVAFASNSFGYEATNFAMKQLLSGASAQKACSYFLFTNADNLYGGVFLETALPGMQSGLDLLGFNFVTRYDQKPGLFQNYKLFRSAHMPMQDVGFEVGHMDLGAALVSAEAIREARVRFGNVARFYSDSSQDWRLADFDFFSDVMMRKGSKGSKVYDGILFFHQ